MLGVIYVPLEAVAYVGVPGEFARRYGPEDEVSDIATRALVAGEPMRVLASRRHKGERLGACLAWLERRKRDHHMVALATRDERRAAGVRRERDGRKRDNGSLQAKLPVTLGTLPSLILFPNPAHKK